ncbi:MAG: hypothetical protein ABW044_05325, partial [Cellvibrio sp.]
MSDSPAQNLFQKHAHFLRKHSFKLLSIGLSLIALVTAFIIHSNAEKSLVNAKAMLQQQQAMNSEADQAATLLNQYLNPYHSLQERKVIAPPHRLQWLEALQANVDENLIPKINFALSPTVPASGETTIYTHETIGMKVTPMRIEFVLLHEGDILRLLNDMHGKAEGLFSVEACELTRSKELSVGTENSQAFLRENFKGSC